MAQFIVLEGIDGSGKGTQVELIAKRLRDAGKKVALLDFPRYKHASGFMVSKYLNGEYGGLSEIGAELGSMFYAVDRFDAKAETKQALLENDYVIANRYVSSNMIHQSTKLDSYEQVDAFLNWVYDLEYRIFGIPKPDRVIFLKISPETSMQLIGMKEKRAYIQSETNKDLHEKDANHLRRASELALYVASKFPNWVIVDCEKNGEILPKDDITDLILSNL
jgi:dTMP kinase